MTQWGPHPYGEDKATSSLPIHLHFSSLSILPLSLSLSLVHPAAVGWPAVARWEVWRRPVLPGSDGRGGSASPLPNLTGRGVNDGPTAPYPLPDPAVARLPWQWREGRRRWWCLPLRQIRPGGESTTAQWRPPLHQIRWERRRRPDGTCGSGPMGSARWWWRPLTQQQEHKGLMCYLC